MSNKGYYSWIHTLKSAAMQSHTKGVEMINEQRAQRATGAARAKLEGQLNAPPPPPPTRKLDVAGKGYGGKDEEIIDVPGLGRYPRSEIEFHMAGEINRAMEADEPHFEKPSADSIELFDGDPVAFEQMQSMKAAQRSAELAQARGPVDAKPEGNAQAVEDDASDGVVADPENLGQEFITRLPAFSAAADARAETAKLNYKDANRQRRIAARQAASEEGYNADEEGRYALPTADWRTVRESVSDKINRFFRA